MSWQRCPICGGTGTVAAGFYDAGGYTTSTTSAQRPQCRACLGRGILLDPGAPTTVQTPPWRITYGGGSQSSGGFDPTRYRNSTTAVAA